MRGAQEMAVRRRHSGHWASVGCSVSNGQGGRPQRADSRGSYALVIDATRDTIVQRARQYKRLVITVSSVGMAALLTALAQASARPLLALALLPALVIGHFALDLRKVHAWRRSALVAWTEGAVQLDLLSRTLRQVPALPAATLDGMLECLPTWAGSEVPLPARPALARAQDTIGGVAVDALVARSVAWGLVAVVVSCAWMTAQPSWLGALLAAPALGMAWHSWSGRRLRVARAALTRAWQGAAVDASTAEEWLARLNWQGVPEDVAARWQAAASAQPGSTH
jgi:hypothetical protein